MACALERLAKSSDREERYRTHKLYTATSYAVNNLIANPHARGGVRSPGRDQPCSHRGPDTSQDGKRKIVASLCHCQPLLAFRAHDESIVCKTITANRDRGPNLLNAPEESTKAICDKILGSR